MKFTVLMDSVCSEQCLQIGDSQDAYGPSGMSELGALLLLLLSYMVHKKKLWKKYELIASILKSGSFLKRQIF